MRSSGVRGLLIYCGLSLQPFDRDQRRPMARSGPALRSGTALCLPGLRQGRRRCPARLLLG